jgi:hypothetical protein
MLPTYFIAYFTLYYSEQKKKGKGWNTDEHNEKYIEKKQRKEKN